MRNCCVPNCLNNSHRLRKWRELHCSLHDCNYGTLPCTCHPPFELFTFPTEQRNPKARQKWIEFVNKVMGENWQPNEHNRICSLHFVDGEPTVEHPVPTVMDVENSNMQSFFKKYKAPQEAKRRRTEPHHEAKTRRTSYPNALEMGAVTEDEGVSAKGQASDFSPALHDHKKDNSSPERECTKPPPTNLRFVFRIPECRRPDCPCLFRKLPEWKPSSTSSSSVDQTGPGSTVPESDHSALKHKHSQLQTKCTNLCKNLKKLKAQNQLLKAALQTTHFCFVSVRCKPSEVLFLTGLTPAMFDWVLQAIKPGVQAVHDSLTLEDHLLAVLMKLKLGLADEDIAFRFDIVTEVDIANILRRWLPVVSQTLKPLIKWQRKYEIQRKMPKWFKAKYRRCRCILSRAEISTSRPANVTTDSTSNETVKYLVGFSPAGAVTFLSSGWEGPVSDKKLVAKSGFYKLLEVNDEVMADGGFSIGQELASHGAALRIPQHTDRVHVRRAMSRWNSFQILSSVIPEAQVDLLNHMVITCAALANISKCGGT